MKSFAGGRKDGIGARDDARIPKGAQVRWSMVDHSNTVARMLTRRVAKADEQVDETLAGGVILWVRGMEDIVTR